ncbi:MAG: methionine--tRNA ligase subunit beta [Candidatus Paceibacterota bacterium]
MEQDNTQFTPLSVGAPKPETAPIVAEVVKPKIKYEDFAKIELKVAKVLTAERKEGSEKLLRLKISLGNEERIILAGIAKAYEPEALVGKELVVVANLEPRKMMGEESNGMLLAATGSEGVAIVLRPEREAGEGATIK